MASSTVTTIVLIFLLITPVSGGPICTAACTLLVGTGVVAGTVGALTAFGFGAAGVTAGSAAASWMSTYGGAVASGSLFSTLQSAGAAGLCASTKALLGGSTLPVCLAVCAPVP